MNYHYNRGRNVSGSVQSLHFHQHLGNSYLTGKYQDSCETCLETNEYNKKGERDNPVDFANLQKGRAYKKCLYCTDCNILARGDASLDVDYDKTFHAVCNALAAEHEPNGCSAMSVHEVRQLRTYLLTEGKDSFKNCQMWLMVILGIKLFLRSDEVVKLELSQFRTECAVVDIQNTTVDHLVVWIKGKSDTKAVSLSLWRDDENPEFCPICALLTYLGKANLEGGYSFPDWADLKEHMDANPGVAASFRTPALYYYLKLALKVS